MFDMFISLERNSAKRLQKERFNSLFYSCAIAIHLDEKVTQFLLKYDHITNQLACICRRFEDLEFVRVMAAIGVIVGMHLVEPFISLTTSTKTTRSKLEVAFKKLYTDLA